MHDIEPFFNWRHLYVSEEDKRSPFFGIEYSEFQFTQTVYNYFIHPQWDDFGSQTLYLKVLFVDYETGFCIIEFIGEWNDAIENDVMTLKREVIDKFIRQGINKFILIGENVLNFHSGDDCYYEEWYDDVVDEGGWVVMIGLPNSSTYDFNRAGLGRYIQLLELPEWRPFSPTNLFMKIDNLILKRLNNS